jgi:dienelactone hydrolase
MSMRESSAALRHFAEWLGVFASAIGAIACAHSEEPGGGDEATAGSGGAATGAAGGSVSWAGARAGSTNGGSLAGAAGASNGSGTSGGASAGTAGQPTNGGSTSGGAMGNDSPTMLPTAAETCPSIQSGNMTFLGQSVTVWAGAPAASSGGPLVIYWHATGGVPQEAVSGLGQAAIDEITAQGGMVAAQAQTTGMGTNTGNNVWFTGDFAVADEIVACAIEQLHIDVRRIYASGFSAGGLQTAWMSYERSGYLAAVVPYSGGLTGLAGIVLTPTETPQDPSNVPAAMAVHGRAGADVVILDFAVQSLAYLDDVNAKGGFAVECDHGGGHMIPSAIPASTWQFLKAHAFKTKPSPYAAGLPASFPEYCKIH